MRKSGGVAKNGGGDFAPDQAASLITRVLEQSCFGAEAEVPLEETVASHFTPDYVQCTDGSEIDLDGFTAHLRALRAAVAHGRVEVIDVVVQGDRVADRHRVYVTKVDGTTATMEVFMLARLAADGRISRVDEVSRVIDGSAQDANLASMV